jgi:hypothetical protein
MPGGAPVGRTAIWITLLLIVPNAVGMEPAPAAATGEPLYLRLELGIENTKVIEACLVKSAGSSIGYDAVLLDLNGDGELETKRAIGHTVHPRTNRRIRDVRLPVRHSGAIWTLELDALKSPVSARALTAGTTSVHWSVQANGLYVRFLGAPLTLHRSQEVARANAPFRMGPPLTFEIGSATRGENPTVTMDLVSPSGGSLAIVMRDGKEVRPNVRILAAGEQMVAAQPGYSWNGICHVLAAVPAGEYEVTFSLDLSPLFENFDLSEIVRLSPPPPDAIDRQIENLSSDDPEARRRAV